MIASIMLKTIRHEKRVSKRLYESKWPGPSTKADIVRPIMFAGFTGVALRGGGVIKSIIRISA